VIFFISLASRRAITALIARGGDFFADSGVVEPAIETRTYCGFFLAMIATPYRCR
jgi:hypothetical protein